MYIKADDGSFIPCGNDTDVDWLSLSQTSRSFGAKCSTTAACLTGWSTSARPTSKSGSAGVDGRWEHRWPSC